MSNYTADGVYVPKTKIALASSFEGIVNNGATECGLVSLNAYHSMEQFESFYDHIITPDEFNDKAVKGGVMEAFLRLRPIVEVAEDYLTVLQVIKKNPALIDSMLSEPDNEGNYDALEERFNELRDVTASQRVDFKQAFYEERERLQKDNYTAWLSTQSPYPGAIDQFRMLAATQVPHDEVEDGIKSGFVPWFATSKDEDSTYALCELYSELGRFQKGDVSDEPLNGCAINRERILGKNIGRDKVEQMKRIAAIEGIPTKNAWRLNDRYDEQQQEDLADNGFRNQFIVTDGYAFPHDIRKAHDDPLVRVIDKKNMARQLASRAEEMGL